MNIMMLLKISAIDRMSCLISAQCSIIVQPPNHDRIVSTIESTPSILMPVVAPLPILTISGGGLAISCRIAMILSSRSKSVLSSMPLNGAGAGFALLFMTFVMGLMVSVTVSPSDIRWAISTRICDVPIDDYEDKYAIIWFDTKGKALEIIYNLMAA